MQELVKAKLKIVDGLDEMMKEVCDFLEFEPRSPHYQEIFCGKIKSNVRQLDQWVQCMSSDWEVTWWEILGDIIFRGRRNECKKFAKLFSMSIDKRDQKGRGEGSFTRVLHLMVHVTEEKIAEEKKTGSKVAIKGTEKWEKVCLSTQNRHRGAREGCF